jgi:hypothetical protein
MKEEIGIENYRKLLYFFENDCEVHFKDLDGIWYNGLILDLSETKLTLVLSERIMGTIPLLLECIDPDSISKFKERGR